MKGPPGESSPAVRNLRAGRAERADPGDGVPPPMRAMVEHYNHAGLIANPLALRAVLGREPRSLRAYFDELHKEGQAA
jgi:hypothetical protein